MIAADGGVFRLETANTAYIFRITGYGHPEHIYYGTRTGSPSAEEIEAAALRRTAQAGSTVAYKRDDPLYCLDMICLEWSGIGKGDYRFSPAEIKMPDGGFVNDFIYYGHTVRQGAVPPEKLPAARGSEDECSSLELYLRDTACDVRLTMIYTVLPRRLYNYN